MDNEKSVDFGDTANVVNITKQPHSLTVFSENLPCKLLNHWLVYNVNIVEEKISLINVLN